MLTLSDKITKIINDSLKKSLKRLTMAEQSCKQNMVERDSVQSELNKNLKMRGMLEKMT